MRPIRNLLLFLLDLDSLLFSLVLIHDDVVPDGVSLLLQPLHQVLQLLLVAAQLSQFFHRIDEPAKKKVNHQY